MADPPPYPRPELPGHVFGPQLMSASTATTLAWLGIGGALILVMAFALATMGDPGPGPESPPRGAVVAPRT